MRVAILTMWAENYSELAAITIPVMEKYCSKHNYNLIALKIPQLQDNSYGFEKIRQLKNIINDYDAILCIDPDALITSHEIKIEDFIKDHHSLYISKDINGFNAGVFIVTNTEWTDGLLNYILSLKGEFNNEQEAIEELYSPDSLIKELTFPNNLQSIPYEFYAPTWGSIKGTQKGKPTHDEGCWEPLDFICHVPGLALNERINILRNIKIIE